ncbi:polysaccharide biosynthesis/export family protein [Rhizobium sp. ICMP 5592]|uniref:polysaccharide biosynthesis/export family protein n=1 Tax=Rhizobium sp. ICMP 5592 TaxID=2292445 RepID=UPI001295122D|nr:polysaccharide biosynthesis/export family protein [Rhizobium sp. ICMP 5592]MQB40608.1 exopolysaccharide biosynthesis protein [Rhizobium sp. ICMP 5592]
MKIISLSALSIVAALSLLPQKGFSDERDAYKLGPGDILQLSVFGVADFARRVTVNIDGNISVPFLGELHSEGLTIHDLRVALTDGLTKDGRIQSADVSVEIVELRPFYISGDVSRPGAVPYRPGLTVRHAIALAGGYDALRFRTENPLMTAPDLKSENEALWIDLARQKARAISLRAELNKTPDIDLTSIYSAPLQRKTLDEIASFEESDLKMRLANYAKQRTYLQIAVKNAEGTIKTLQDRRERNEESIQLQQDAVDRMNVSASKGLVMANRVDDERRSLAEIRSQQGDTEARLVQAQHDRDELARNLEIQDEQHNTQLNDSLRDTSIEIEKLAGRIRASSEKLLYTGAVKAQMRGGEGGPSLVIYRKNGEQTMQVAAQEDTPLRPDDVLEVTIRPEQMVMSPNSQ